MTQDSTRAFAGERLLPGAIGLFGPFGSLKRATCQTALDVARVVRDIHPLVLGRAQIGIVAF